jgi:hypothetical protein
MKELVEIVVSSEGGNDAEKALACVMFKKYYLDDRKEEKALEQITPQQVAEAKAALKASLNFTQDNLHLLRRKAEILCKFHRREESHAELVQYI